MRNLHDWAAPLRAAVQDWLVARFEGTWPPQLGEACRYPLMTGGKRMRPLLAFAAAEAVGGRDAVAVALPAACAVELVHTYSLVHDDLPCMDDDDERRGRPTVHKVYGEGAAVLVGDALLTEAFLVLAGTGNAALVSELARAAGHWGMVAGQAADVGLGGTAQTLEEVLAVHRAKTGALIRAAVRLGGISAGADDAALAALTTYGEAVGLAFQLADDVLDADQDAGDSGPPSTVRLLGVAETQRRASALLEQAVQAAHTLPHPGALEALARYTVSRDH